MADWQAYNVDGRALDVLHQQFFDGCALACVAMAVNRRDGSRPTERAVMNVLGSGGYRPEPALSRYIPAQRDRAADKGTNFGYTGTYATAVPDYLREYGIMAQCHFFASDSAFTHFIENVYNPKFPLILKVHVGAQPHFIVLEGFQKSDTEKTDVIISDPAKRPIGGAMPAQFAVARGNQNYICRSDGKFAYIAREGIQCSW
jgi:hypothetical protein